MDLTAIEKPFGLLDTETQDALKAHGGPYEFYSMNGNWDETPMPGWISNSIYRVKPAPPKPREFWVTVDDGFWWATEEHANEAGAGEVIHVREVLE